MFFLLGAINPYCEITVGSITLKTPFIKRTNNPKWNESMQFLFYNIVEDIIHINIFDHELFSPNGLFIFYYYKNYFHFLENIGYTTIYLTDLLPSSLDPFRTQPSHTFIQTIYLNNGASIVVKCTVEFLSPCQ